MRRSDQRRDAVFASYQRDVTGRPLEELIAGARPLTRELAEGVDAHREELDEIVASYAKGWTVERIAPLDLNVLRVALYEIEHGEVPYEVAIDEAVEIAKEYCGADAPKFINGILGAVVREREPANVSEGAPRSDSSRPSEREAGDVQ
ncbi:MAG TPA: transcription antitermination factor NusB [Solirubrobacterales bacterium]|nr:transcription antitermination factor NusB [Solirubrobacterales bacterium]